MANTILCYRLGRPESLVRVDVEIFNRDNEAAEEADQEHPWIIADEDAESDAPTYDQLSKAEQKKVDEQVAERQARIDAEKASD